MKAVLISIKPQWAKLIAEGKKTVEVRKTKPKIDVPFKCYIYCTKDKPIFEQSAFSTDVSNGKVIGEFVCDEICEQRPYKWREGGFEGLNWKYNSDFSEISCVSQDELMRYGNRKTLYAWHITDLVIYDKPRELGEFYNKCKNMRCEGCEHLKYQQVNSDERDYDCEYLGGNIPLLRAPQSWCYVEKLGV